MFNFLRKKQKDYTICKPIITSYINDINAGIEKLYEYGNHNVWYNVEIRKPYKFNEKNINGIIDNLKNKLKYPYIMISYFDIHVETVNNKTVKYEKCCSNYNPCGSDKLSFNIKDVSYNHMLTDIKTFKIKRYNVGKKFTKRTIRDIKSLLRYLDTIGQVL